ncbi:MAG: antibiotic biosynthesis monooxygenase [Rhodovulum sulfidophilum]|uniref:Antibiotic biosynthesis monooxygenase n=1 Tax=Rhodovulum sulfidophilum TaxID=35806 RepID=A0A2W5PYE2_RHOSU|nr:MAG: antibiotic biosynthesis monooxygenase [Rhodovulum sulfidophilum]
MFVAMNRFRIVPGSEAAFEEAWRNRDSRLHEVDGFQSFRLLRGPSTEEHTLYVSHSFWRDRDAFEAWTRSEQFRHAHAGAGERKPLYVGGPQFEGFETVLES